ncbi:MAG: CBS domain-containing protein [Candidatus Omnitrophica bacterium]|nr:CBS domain-containing protein [Candidatus Omnitrophota bacterium]
MLLSSVLNTNIISLHVKAQNKKEAFRELIDCACSRHKDFDRDALLQAVLDRELQQSTYLGKSLALPHARIEGLKDFIIVCGRSDEGVHFEETNDTVTFIVMILACKTKMNILLQTMGAFATLFNDDAIISQLKAARTVPDFIEIIKNSTVEIKQTLVAKDIMQKNVVTLSPDQTLKEVVDIFFSKNISGAPVVHDDGTIAGIVTEKEIIKIGFPNYMSLMEDISFLNEFQPFEQIFEKEDSILVKDIYSNQFLYTHENTSVIQLAFYFTQKNCRRLLITDDNKKLLGMVLRKDLIRKVIHA